MTELIREILQQFGPRLAGSKAEGDAQKFIKEKLSEFATGIHQQFFVAPLTAKFRKMKIYAVLYWLSVISFWLNPFLAMFLALLNAFLTVNDLMRNGTILDFLYPQMTSSNVTAWVEPTGKARQTIIFSGHIDSTEECQWWYWLKQAGAYLTFAAGGIIMVYAVFTTTNAFWILAFGKYFLPWANWGFIALSPVLIVYFTFHSKKVVSGAADNLSGIAIAFALIKYFSEHPLQFTRIRFISFGAEEKGLRGSKAYVASYGKQLADENSMLVNIDTIRLTNEISIINKETMIGVKHHAELVKRVRAAFDRLKLPCKVNPLPMGGTDAIPFSLSGIPAISIIGLNTKKLDPTYHTRLDTLDMLQPQALEHVKQALIEFAKDLDRKSL